MVTRREPDLQNSVTVYKQCPFLWPTHCCYGNEAAYGHQVYSFIVHRCLLSVAAVLVIYIHLFVCIFSQIAQTSTGKYSEIRFKKKLSPWKCLSRCFTPTMTYMLHIFFVFMKQTCIWLHIQPAMWKQGMRHDILLFRCFHNYTLTKSQFHIHNLFRFFHFLAQNSFLLWFFFFKCNS